MKNLRYDLYEHEGSKSPYLVITDLGIKYNHWVPQTMGDQIWLLDCSNIPDELPKAISKLGLSQSQIDHWIK